VCSFSGEEQCTVWISLEASAIGDEISNDILRGTNHQIYRGLVILIMSSLQSVLEVAVIVVIILQHADTALG
jgi:hypothetical protein